MVDRLSLEIVGFIFGAVTAVVIAIGIVVVYANVDGRMALRQAMPVISVSLDARQ